MERKTKIILTVAIVFILIPAIFLFSKKEKKIQLNMKESSETTGNIKLSENNPLATEDIPGSQSSEVLAEKTQTEKEIHAEETENTEKNLPEDKINSAKITNKLVGWGYEKANTRKIDTIIVHSTYNITSKDPFDLEAIIYKEYKPYGVSPHYIIDRNGKIYRLVEEKNIAYHAGESKMPDGRTGVNNFSIGIELVNSKDSKPTGEQYSSLKYLISYIKSEYHIKYTLGHSDIAQKRKDDPWNFDWNKVK